MIQIQVSLQTDNDPIFVLASCEPKLHVSISYFYVYNILYCGSGSSVGIATDYGMDGPRSNPGGDEPSLLYNGYRVFPGGKVRPVRAADHSLRSSAAVMEE